MSRNWIIAGVAAVCLVVGIALSHRIETGVRVQNVTLAEQTPALKFIPAGAGPHPVALLAHGYSGSKEGLFCYGEALAAAGFECFAVDLPGHGMSPQSYSFIGAAHTLEDVAQKVGPVDVFIGHSMGGFAGGEAVREGGMKPKLFIAVGSIPHLGEHASPLLLLAGRFDEYFPPALLKTRTDARLVLSPWSDHVFEKWDPVLVKASVEAACAVVGKTPPAAPTWWCWRLVGVMLAVLGSLGLAFYLPKLPRRWAWVRGLLVSVVILGGVFDFTSGTFLDTMPHVRHFPLQIAAAAITLLMLWGAGKLRISRWGFTALASVVWVCMIAIADIRLLLMSHMPHFAMVFIPALFVGAVVGEIAAHRGSRSDGNIAMAIIVGCALFQWGQPLKTNPGAPPRVVIKLDTKLLDACAGQYEIVPDNVFRSGARVVIWRQGDQMFLQATGDGVLHGVLHGVHEIFPESETNLFLKINGAELMFIKNGKGEVTGVIHHMTGLPDSEGKKLKNE